MWGITLRVDSNGIAVITSLTDGIPPGEIEIRGSDDGNRATLTARQRDARGRFTVSAHHTRDRAEEALGAAEDLAGAVTGAGGAAAVEVGVTGELPLP